MKVIASIWDDFVTVAAVGATSDERQHMRDAFYCGAAAVFAAIDGDPLLADDISAELMEWKDEIAHRAQQKELGS